MCIFGVFRQIAASKMLFFYILGYWNQPQIHQVWWCRYRRVDPFQAHVRGSLLRIPPSWTFRRQVNNFFTSGNVLPFLFSIHKRIPYSSISSEKKMVYSFPYFIWKILDLVKFNLKPQLVCEFSLFIYLSFRQWKLNWHPWNLVEIILRRICNCQKTYSIRSTARFSTYHWLDESIPDLHEQ